MPETQYWAGQESVSTRHAVMNATFIGSGVRALLAGVVLAPFVPRRGRWAVLPLVLAYSVGLVIVGSFPSATGGLRETMHGIGAWLGVIGGGVLLLAIAITLARRHAVLATVTGVCAAIALGGGWLAVWRAPEHFGLYERIAVDVVIGWQVLTGAALLMSRRRNSAALRQGE